MTWPDYSAAPVVEVVVGVEFAPLPNFGVLSFGALHELWKARYPEVAEREALPPTRPLRASGGFEFQFGQGTPPTRLWMASQGGERLIQIQHDRLLLNWRKVESAGESAAYPGHEALVAEFRQLFEEFATSTAVGGVPLTPLVTEWSYVNRLTSDHLLDGQALSVWTAPDLPIETEPLFTNLQHVRRFHHEGRDGQVEVSAAPQQIGEMSAGLLTISVKCFHRPDTTMASALDSAEAAWQVARATFAATTTESARKQWGEAR